MNTDTAFSAFLIIGFILVTGAALTLGVLVIRYMKDMRAQGFFGGKKKDEEE